MNCNVQNPRSIKAKARAIRNRWFYSVLAAEFALTARQDFVRDHGISFSPALFHLETIVEYFGLAFYVWQSVTAWYLHITNGSHSDAGEGVLIGGTVI